MLRLRGGGPRTPRRSFAQESKEHLWNVGLLASRWSITILGLDMMERLSIPVNRYFYNASGNATNRLLKTRKHRVNTINLDRLCFHFCRSIASSIAERRWKFWLYRLKNSWMIDWAFRMHMKGDPRKTQRFQKLITLLLFVAKSSFFSERSFFYRYCIDSRESERGHSRIQQSSTASVSIQSLRFFNLFRSVGPEKGRFLGRSTENFGGDGVRGSNASRRSGGSPCGCRLWGRDLWDQTKEFAQEWIEWIGDETSRRVEFRISLIANVQVRKLFCVSRHLF